MSSYSLPYLLRIFIDSDDQDLKKMYEEHIEKHNAKVNEGKVTGNADSGFDLFVPLETVIKKEQLFQTQKIDSLIKTEMIYYDVEKNEYVSHPYCLYARSSISKTPLMLANHVGIVDSGYRGNVIGAVRCLYMDPRNPECYTIEKFTRLFQICLPTLEPFQVTIVNELSDLSMTGRGEGGFGSTGLVGISK